MGPAPPAERGGEVAGDAAEVAAPPPFSGGCYEDVEGMTVSLGVIFALLLPGAMALQNQAFDDGIQSKNFLLLTCTQKEFREYVVDTLDAASFAWNVTLGAGKALDARATLLDQDSWVWEAKGPPAIYLCGAKKEFAAAMRAVFDAFPAWRTDAWALMNPHAALWSDNVNGMASFAMSGLIAGLIGSLAIYISLAMSSAREDETGAALAAWNRLGFPMLASLGLLLIAMIVVLLFANDAYTESQDVFFLRAGRFNGYAKIALLALFVPLVVFFGVGSVFSLRKSYRASRRA